MPIIDESELTRNTEIRPDDEGDHTMPVVSVQWALR
jgi:hypothetical protein